MDIHRPSQESLKFYKKINLDVYKNLNSVDLWVESETSNNSEKSNNNCAFNVFNEHKNTEGISNKSNNIKSKVINYPLQKQYADRAQSREDSNNLEYLNENIRFHPFYLKSYQELDNNQLLQHQYDDSSKVENNNIKNPNNESDNIKDDDRQFNRNKQQASSLQRFTRESK